MYSTLNYIIPSCDTGPLDCRRDRLGLNVILIRFLILIRCEFLSIVDCDLFSVVPKLI